MSIAGSLVLRLYVALVYMREGVLNDLVNQGARSRRPCCVVVRSLLNCESVRRLRNALAHGTFSSCVAGLAFRDSRGRVPATPGFLSLLSTQLMLVQLQAVAACGGRPDEGGAACGP